MHLGLDPWVCGRRPVLSEDAEDLREEGWSLDR